MTMRSAPPSSSPLAERPVPAPAPTIGSPRAFIALSLARMSERLRAAMPLSSRLPAGGAGADKPAKLGDDLRREARIVDMRRDSDQAPRAGLAHRRFERSEQGFVGGRVVEGLSGRVERRDAAGRQE